MKISLRKLSRVVIIGLLAFLLPMSLLIVLADKGEHKEHENFSYINSNVHECERNHVDYDIPENYQGPSYGQGDVYLDRK